jgi:Zn-dependent protease with chaperone function
MASGIEYRQARQAAQQFEHSAYKFVGCAALGVMTLIGVGVVAFNSRQSEASADTMAVAAERPAKQSATASKMTSYERCMASAKLSGAMHVVALKVTPASSEDATRISEIHRILAEQQCEQLEQVRNR